METIEYRYTQGMTTLVAAVQLKSNGKYWNNTNSVWQDELDSDCKMDLIEVIDANMTDENIEEYPFLKLYKERLEDGLYVTSSENLNVAPGTLYSIHVFDGEQLISTTTRYKESSRKFLEMINEVQGRLGFPLSIRLREPNAKKIGMMMNDVITELLPCGNSTKNVISLYHVFVKAGSTEVWISPANTRNLNGLGLITIHNSPLVQAEGEKTTSFITNSKSIPTTYIVSTKSNHSIGITLNSELLEDIYIDIEVYERPSALIFASDRTVYDSDLVIKGTEYIARDDFGMGGDVSGRELFLRYLSTDSNLNSDTNWSRMSV